MRGTRLRLGKLQADRDDAVVGHRVRHELHRAERDRVVGARRVLDEIRGEIIRQRRAGVLRRDRQAVDFGERAERDIARHEEILDQRGVGRRLRRPLGKEAVERLHAVRRRQEIDVIALAHLRRPPPASARARRAPPA